MAATGSLILFVGTKRQAADTIEREALRCGMPFVSDRWLGGTLTNFRTIRSRLGRLEELEGLMASEEFATYSKKMQSALKREFRKMYRNLNGMRTMNRLPECMVVIDPKKEKNAVSEARKLGVATVALIDTDCDPDLVDLPIPGNDDSIRSIELIMQQLADAVLEGKTEAATKGITSRTGEAKPAAGSETRPEPPRGPVRRRAPNRSRSRQCRRQYRQNARHASRRIRDRRADRLPRCPLIAASGSEQPDATANTSACGFYRHWFSPNRINF